jgi:predicted flap endonuclease-1-like 5' DNA nuclease
VVGWLCRSLAAPRRPQAAASRTRAGHREQEAQREQVEQLEARLAEAVAGAKALQEELVQAREAAEAEASASRRREQEQHGKRAALEAEVARLGAELEARRAQTALPLPPDTVSSPLTRGRLEVAEPQAEAPPPAQVEVPEPQADAPPPAQVEVAQPQASTLPTPPEVADPEAGVPPSGLVAPQGAADDLKRISGVGQGIERALNENGIFHFRQIAALTPPNLVWLDHHLRLKGRIAREDWIGQAKALAAEGEVEEPGPLARQT